MPFERHVIQSVVKHRMHPQILIHVIEFIMNKTNRKQMNMDYVLLFAKVITCNHLIIFKIFIQERHRSRKEKMSVCLQVQIYTR